jgi:hypothetical protein
MMVKIVGGDKSVIPASKQKYIPTLVIDQKNVDDFITKINQLRGRS